VIYLCSMHRSAKRDGEWKRNEVKKNRTFNWR
jgi:hypothetical protein